MRDVNAAARGRLHICQSCPYTPTTQGTETMHTQRVVIIGAGQAAAQLATSLRAGGHTGSIVMLGDEPVPPYQRPPLSKAYLSGAMGMDRVILKPLDAWAADKVDLHVSSPVAAIHRERREVGLQSGQAFGYDVLVIATGSRVRPLPLPGADLPGVHYLRTMADVDGLSPDIVPGKKLVVIGGGYIGLEVAAVARKAGLDVTILEAAPRVLARVAPPEISHFFEELHRQAGVRILTNVKVAGLEGRG